MLTLDKLSWNVTRDAPVFDISYTMHSRTFRDALLHRHLETLYLRVGFERGFRSLAPLQVVLDAKPELLKLVAPTGSQATSAAGSPHAFGVYIYRDVYIHMYICMYM